MIAPGQKAPDFVAPVYRDGAGEMLDLVTVMEDVAGIVLLFAPADFVGPCTAEFCAVRDAGWAEEADLAVLAATGDSLFSHAAYADRYDIPFPLVSDFHGSIADSYGLALEEWEGHRQIPGRATVVVDGDWTVRAVESADPLAHADPAPAARVTGTVQDLGFDVEPPTVDYEKYGSR